MSEDRGAKTAVGAASLVSLRRSRSRTLPPPPLLPYGAGPFASSNRHLPSFRKADAHLRSCDGVTLARVNALRRSDRDLAWLCSIYKRHMATMRTERKHMHRAFVTERHSVLSLQQSVDNVSLVAHQSSDSLFYPTAQSGIDSSESTFSVSSGSNQASPPQQLMRRLTGGPQPAPTWSSTTALAMMLKRSCPILLSAKLVCSALLLCGLIKTSKIPALAGLISLSASCDMDNEVLWGAGG